MKHIVIVGGGFGGLFAARALSRANLQITLLDKRNFHTFQPLLYQVATGTLTTGDIATPHRLLLRHRQNVRVLMSEALDLDPVRKQVIHEHGELHYDALIVATGVEHSYFGQDAWARFAPGLKTLEHALEMRRRVFLSLEQAELETDPERRTALMTFVVVGAGPTGVELAGALGEMAQHRMKGDYRGFDPKQCRILLLEGAPEVLPAMPPPLREAARASLTQLGVTVLTSAKVQHIDASGVDYSHEGQVHHLQAGTVLWAAGVQASRFGARVAQATGATKDRAGRLEVDEHLALPGHPDIFVVGDLAHARSNDGSTVPGLAPAAIQMGEYVAKLLARRDASEPMASFHYVDKGTMAVIGRHHAVADLHWIKLKGTIAWLLWALIHIWSLVQPEKRLRVFGQWIWRYFITRTGDRLITGTHPTDRKDGV